MTVATRPRGRQQGDVLRRVLAYSASRGVTEGLLSLRGVALAALLGPAAFGIWALLRLSMRYGAMAGLGVFRGLELELLVERTGERSHDAPASVALGFILVVMGTIAAASVGASFVVRDPNHVLLLRGFAAALLGEQLYAYVLVCTRVRQDLRRYAILENTHAVLQLVCVLGLAIHAGLGGALAGLALASFATVALAARNVSLRPSLRWPTLRRLLREGTPLAANMVLTSALATADRWIVAWFGGVTMLGYYAFAAQVAGLAVTFAWVIRTVIFPDVYRKARSAQAAQALRTHLETTVLPFARLFPPLLGALSFVVGPVVALALPRYVEAIAPARIFLLAGAAAGIVSLTAIGAVAAGRQRRLPLLSAVALAVNLSLSFVAVLSGAGLEFVAAASFIGQTTFAAGVLALVRRESGANDVPAFLRRVLTPLAWCVALVTLVGAILPANDSRSNLLALALYLVLLVPLVPTMRTDWRRVNG